MCMNDLRRLTTRAAVALLVVAGAAACSLDNQERPSLSGPSELGLSIAMTASPDQLPRDGSSQSVVTLTARDPAGRPVAGQRLNLSMPVNAPSGATLSATDVVTNANGQLSFAVTAPVAGSIGNVVILATPLGNDANNATARTISISAIPSNGAPPTPAFTITPAAPEVGQVVTLDASSTTDEGRACTDQCTFAWDFGSEGTAVGRIITHVFQAGGPYVLTLTVTDGAQSIATLQRTITVLALGPPTVSINPSVPAQPVATQAATFTATAVPATNHRIVSYSWSWGDGSSNQTAAPSIQHTYSTPGPYLVSLTVRDDLGQSASAFSPITVTSGLTATLTWLPAVPSIGQTVTFTAVATSNVGSTITNYLFDFGDGTSQSSSFPTAKHEYSKSDAFVVKLTVTDDKGRTHTTTPQFLQVP